MIIRTEDTKQCPDILPVCDTYGSGIILEHRCVLDLNHDGLHKDKDGNVWVNQHAIMRERGLL